MVALHRRQTVRELLGHSIWLCPGHTAECVQDMEHHQNRREKAVALNEVAAEFVRQGRCDRNLVEVAGSPCERTAP